jgi:UDP-N-acetylmuramate--alanine ligase
MDFSKINNVYLVGIGGIGMSALARYFKTLGMFVAGYDKTATTLTDQLIAEGIDVHFEDKLSLIPSQIYSEKENTLIIYTPAVPNYHYEFNYFKEREYMLMKRAEVLGVIFSNRKGIAVAGTHGKTTTSTMLAHLLKQSAVDCSAFLGGISKNYSSNLLLSDKSDIVVAEADEFDRSFLRLYPHLAIVTSVDADHLDIYGTHEEVIKSFNQFTQQISENGYLIYKKGISLSLEGMNDVQVYTYSVGEVADFYPTNIRLFNGLYSFDIQTPMGLINDLTLGVSGKMNLENSIAAIAAALILEVKPAELRASLASFAGVKRRFETHVNNKNFVYIDDYAHHPEELKACVNSAKDVFPGKKITGIFQPHLFTRTRDFADGFAESLSLFDSVILLEIYPARELPIPGITSEIIFDKLTCTNKTLCTKDQLMEVLKKHRPEVLITVGAGDIDKFVPLIKAWGEKEFEA